MTELKEEKDRSRSGGRRDARYLHSGRPGCVLDHDISFDGVIGVSAGQCMGLRLCRGRRSGASAIIKILQ